VHPHFAFFPQHHFAPPSRCRWTLTTRRASICDPCSLDLRAPAIAGEFDDKIYAGISVQYADQWSGREDSLMFPQAFPLCTLALPSPLINLLYLPLQRNHPTVTSNARIGPPTPPPRPAVVVTLNRLSPSLLSFARFRADYFVVLAQAWISYACSVQ